VADQDDPYKLARLLDRRRFLTLSGAGAGTLLGLTACGDSGDARAHPRPVKDGATLGATEHPSQPAKDGAKLGVAETPSPLHPPYTVTADSSLSEDHFLIKPGSVDPTTDTVVAYSRVDGETEAVLLQKGTISQVYRDPTASGGWNSRAVAAGATDMVAGTAVDKQGALSLHIFYRNTAGSVVHLQEGPPLTGGISSGQFTLVATMDWVAVPLQITTDVLQNLLVFTYVPSSAPGHTDAKLRFHWTGNGFRTSDPYDATISGFEFNKPDSTSTACAAVAFDQVLHPTVWLYVPNATRSSIDVSYAWLAGGKITEFNHPQVQPPSYAPLKVSSVDYMTTNKYGVPPTGVIRSSDNQLHTLTRNTTETAGWHWVPLTLPAGDGGRLRWEPSNVVQGHDVTTSSNLLNLFVVSAQTLSVVRQVNQGDSIMDAETPVFNPAVPLQNSVAAVISQARPSSGDELIVVGTDGYLQLLAKTLTGNWSATDIHLPATEPLQVTTYRVQLTLSDSWGVRIPKQTLQVVSSAPAIALLNGQGVQLSSTATTFTTDIRGQVTIPIVADGLYAPTLTITGGGLSSPLVVSPSGPVNTYMTGAGTLNFLPEMTGATLASATLDGGSPVYPHAKSDANVATAAAGVFSNAAKAGANPSGVSLNAPAPAGGGLGVQEQQAGKRQPAYNPRPTHQVLGRAPAQVEKTMTVEGLQLSFHDLGSDAWYAIKTGAAKVQQVAFTFDSSAKRWVGQITADFDAWAQQALSVVITDLETAAHVFHGVINYLGAKLSDVLDWLKVHILKLLDDTVALAARYDAWLLQLADHLSTLVQDSKTGANAWLKRQGALIQGDLAKLKTELGSKTIASFAQAPQLSRSLEASPTPVPTAPTDARSQWLLQAVTQANPSSGTPTLDDALRTLMRDVTAKVQAGGKDFIKAANAFRDALASFVANPKDFGTAGIDKLIDAFAAVIDIAVTAAELVSDVVLDLLVVAISAFKTILATPITDLTILGPLLKAAGMTAAPSIGSLVTLLVAFPTVLGYKLAHADLNAVPFSTKINDVGEAGTPAEDLDFVVSSASWFWAFCDTLSASSTANGEDPPVFFTWMDIVVPSVISALTVPAHDGGLPFTSAIKLDDNGDVIEAVAWGLEAAPPVMDAVAYFIGEKYAEPEGETAEESVLFLTSLDGFIAAAFGVGAAITQSPSLPEAALPAVLAILNNVADALVWGLDKSIVSSTYGLSAIVAGVIGGASTSLGAAIEAFGYD
jgi:hypothetical protein